MVRADIAQRIVLVAAAAAAFAWLFVSLQDKHALDSATRAVSGRTLPARAVLDQALRDADRAGRAHPGDTQPLIVKSRVLGAENRVGAALAVAREVVRDEPRNLFAWFVVAIVARQVDPRLVPEAAAAVRRLDPQLAKGG